MAESGVDDSADVATFFCVGAQKAGTTALHEVLVTWPEISMPSRKETHFFSNDEIYAHGIRYYDSRFVGDVRVLSSR